MASEMSDTAIYIGWIIQFSISIIFGSCLLLSTFTHFCKPPQNKLDNRHIYPIIQNVAISYFCCYIIAFILFNIEFILKLTHPDESTDAIEDILWAISFLFGGSAQLFFCLLLIMRLYFTFQETVYKTSRWIYCSFVMGTITFIMFGFCYIASVLSEVDRRLRATFAGLSGSLIIIMRIVLIIVFVFKLCSLIASYNAKRNSHNNEIHAPLLKTITKQILLGSIAVSFNTISLLFVGIERVTRDDEYYREEFGQKYGTKTYFAILLLVISIWIEMFCVYLGFNFNDALYFKCCSPCHDQCCHPIAEEEVKRMSTVLSAKSLPAAPMEVMTSISEENDTSEHSDIKL